MPRMIHVSITIILIAFLLCGTTFVFCELWDRMSEKEVVREAIPFVEVERVDTIWYKTRATTYSPNKAQCGNNRGVTASGRQINMKDIHGSKLCGISVDLMGVLKWGDSVFFRGVPSQYAHGWCVSDRAADSVYLKKKRKWFKIRNAFDLCVSEKDKQGNWTSAEYGIIKKHQR